MTPSEVLWRARELYTTARALDPHIALWMASDRDEDNYMGAYDWWHRADDRVVDRFDRAIALAEAEEEAD